MPGWNDAVKELKDKSIFWKSVWVSAGRPLDNNLHRLMKTTRNKYHFAIKKVKKQEEAIRKSKFLQACLNNKIEDIFSELKAMRNKGGHISKVIDGKNKQPEIAEHFKEMYQEIYNIHDDTAEFNRIKILNSNKINNTDLNIVNRITPAIVQKSIENFHNGKNDSFYEWRSDALKHAKELVATPLADLLKSMIIHGHIPPMFLLCSLIPIIKDNKASKMTSSNYRLIAITSLMLKILDHVVLDLFGSELTPSYHQFGFQKGKSTSLCTWTVMETINYFTNRGSPIFLCLLDLTKAFDFVKLSTLFEKLSKKIPAILIRFLMASYTQQECFVTWDGHHSSTFSISNGVRQGAVLSPALFNFYIDDLYKQLENTGFGCKINRVYFGCFSYADDLALLAPSKEALQSLINKCQEFFKNHGIEISTNQDVKKTKTKILIFGLKTKPAPFLLNGKQLPTVESWQHLGHLLHQDGTLRHDLEEKRRAIIGRIHNLQQEIGNQHPTVYFALLRSYVFHLYGCQLWDISDDSCNKLWAVWHRTIKLAYDLPHATHRYLLNDLVQLDHIKKVVLKRFTKFYQTINTCDIPQVRILNDIQSKDVRSTYCRNINHTLRVAGVRNMNEVNFSNISINPVPPGLEWRIPLLRDLLHNREFGSEILTKNKINIIITEICVTE